MIFEPLAALAVPVEEPLAHEFTPIPGVALHSGRCEPDVVAIVGVMDGIQLQWLLDKDAVDLSEATAFAIESIVAAVMAGCARPRVLSEESVPA